MIFATTSRRCAGPFCSSMICLFVALSCLWPAVAATLDFSANAPVIELKPALSPYHSAEGVEPDGSRWQIVTAVNQSTRPATRILMAEEPPDSSLRLFPHKRRPAIRQIASSDPDVLADPVRAYGRYAFRVTVPAAQTVSLALKLTDADIHPLVAAWSEPALAAHNRQLAVFYAAVAGLIAAALAIVAGLAAMTGHAAPRWAALTLVGVFLSRLAAAGLFDSIGATNIGGPYGLSALLAGLTLAAGISFADTVAPFEVNLARGQRWRGAVQGIVLGLSFMAYVGIPGAMIAVEASVVVGAAAIAVYLVTCGRMGAQAARVAAPGAAVFALVVTIGAIAALGGFSASTAAPGVIGGFASIGAILLALAVAAGEGIAILPARRAAEAPAGPFEYDGEPAHALEAICASHQGIFEFDFESHRINLSPEAAQLIGLSNRRKSFTGDEWTGRIHSEDRDVFTHAMAEFRAQPGLAFRIEFRLVDAVGRDVWLELRAAMRGEGESASRCVGLVADVTARKLGESKATPRHELESLPNRAALLRTLENLGPAYIDVGVAVLDIDRFKAIHESLGDEGGDLVLLECAQRLSRAFGDPVQVFRIGGDGFALIFDAKNTALDVIGRILTEVIRRPAFVDGREVYLSASIGIAQARDSELAPDLLKHAGLALVEAKRHGGGCSRLFVPGIAHAKPVDSVALESELRQALQKGELEVYYQPIMRLRDGTLYGFEALLRWMHPIKGLVEPSGFIDHSERTGAIVELGRFVLEQAASELGRWQKYFPLVPPLTASVNLSRRQMLDPDFEPLLERVMKDQGILAHTLFLELTETVVSSIPDTTAWLTRLKATGAGLAIDDFGTGVSALSQLKHLPFDTLKIDRSFLFQNNASSDESSTVLLRSIIELAHLQKLDVVVEGVESERDARWLKETGCEFGQGYYFSPAIPGSDVPAFIARHHSGNPAGDSSVAGVRRESGDVDSQPA